jgi:hypothetical protein
MGDLLGSLIWGAKSGQYCVIGGGSLHPWLGFGFKTTSSTALGFGSFPNLTFVDLSANNFSGPILEDFGNAINLAYVNISQNQFDFVLPDNLWNATVMQVFSASSAKLIGKIPDFVGCRSLYKIELQGNSLNGSIPWDISHCERYYW